MKNFRNLKLIILTALVTILVMEKKATAQIADTILINGQFYTLDSVNPWAEAVAYKDGTIIYVGAMSGINPFVNSETVSIDLDGKFAMPSFIESHAHPLSTSYGINFTANVGGLPSHEEYIQAITAFVEAHPQAEGILGNGFSTSLYGSLGPGKESLDAIDSNRPIGIVSDDIHALWANSKALEMAGITASTPNPTGGVIVKDPQTGEPTGLLQELPAMSLVWDLLPVASKEEYKTSLLWGQKFLNSVGITTVHDAWVEFDPNYYDAFNELANEGLLTVRYRGSWYVDPNAEFGFSGEIDFGLSLSKNFTHPHFQVNSFKFLADGTIEEATALLAEPYSNQSGYYGIKNWEDTDMATAFNTVDNAGYQIHVHTIGDSATTYSINALELLGVSQNRHSIAHIQLIKPEDIIRMGQLNISALMTPYWMVKNEAYDEIYLPALGRERAETTYPIKSMSDAGINVTVASDWPTSEPKPLMGIYNGITRSNVGGEQLPPSTEVVSIEQMLQSATINGAFANLLEEEVGTIEVGKKADIVVLSENLLEINTEDISNAEVELTIFEGKIVYDKNLVTGVTNLNMFKNNQLLKQIYPNPFDAKTIIKFTLEKRQDVKLSVLDIQGKEIAVIVNDTISKGEHSVEFDGSKLKAGQYIIKIEIEGYIETSKMILQK